MRLVIGKLLTIVRQYPTLVDAAFIIIAWVGVKLFIEYLHSIGVVHFEVNKWLSFGLIAVIFGVAYLIARRKGPVQHEDDMSDEAQELLTESGTVPFLRNRQPANFFILLSDLGELEIHRFGLAVPEREAFGSCL
jgi:putative Mn2+ efflux pump MntP